MAMVGLDAPLQNIIVGAVLVNAVLIDITSRAPQRWPATIALILAQVTLVLTFTAPWWLAVDVGLVAAAVVLRHRLVTLGVALLQVAVVGYLAWPWNLVTVAVLLAATVLVMGVTLLLLTNSQRRKGA
jgi:hypothetical protein